MPHIESVSESCGKTQNRKTTYNFETREKNVSCCLNFTSLVQAELTNKMRPRKNSTETPRVHIQGGYVCLDVELILKPFVSWRQITNLFSFPQAPWHEKSD